MADKTKQPFSKAVPNPSKHPSAGSEPTRFYTERPAWRISHVQMVNPYGWHDLDNTKVGEIRSKLAHFESMTWKEILLDSKKQNHVIKLNRLCKEAQERLHQMFPVVDFDELLSLRLSGKERIWGILEFNVVRVLWWDPGHDVCPSLLKNT